MVNSMLISIGLIVASLIAGVAYGTVRKKISANERKAVSMAMAGMVFILIFLMGVKTGLNRQVMDGLGTYGVNALLLALGAIAGSLLLVVAFDRMFLKGVSK